MKKLIIIGAFLAMTLSASANGKKPSAFGAGLKPNPSVTLFGQKLSWPIPSLCVGKSAGVTPDFGVSSDGLKLKLPYISLDLPFPSLFLGIKDKKVEVKLGAIDKSERAD